MEFEGKRAIRTGKETLWTLVSDPEALVECIPGAKEVERRSEVEYEGVIERGVAGVTISLDGRVELTELDRPDYLSADASGQDAVSNSRMNATAELELHNGDGLETEILYTVDVAFTGRLASLGARIVKRKINSDIEAFFDNVKERAEATDD